jgi:hypothetical protein
MSISYDIYNTEDEFADMSKWECDHFHPIGIPERVIEEINALFFPRTLSWKYYDSSSSTSSTPYVGSYSALATGNCDPDNEYIDLYLTVHKKGYVCEISARKASPKLVQMLMERFSLKYVFEMQSCRLLDPYLYEGNWNFIDDKH